MLKKALSSSELLTFLPASFTSQPPSALYDVIPPNTARHMSLVPLMESVRKLKDAYPGS